MNQDLSLEKFEDFVGTLTKPKSIVGVLLLLFVFFTAIKLFPFVMFIIALVYLNKKRKQAKAEQKGIPKSYKEFKKTKGRRTVQGKNLDDKLKKAVYLTKKKKTELIRKRITLLEELDNLTIVTTQDKEYGEALRSGLDIVNKQIAKVEESYAHLELSVYNKKYQALLRSVKNKKLSKSFNNVKRDLRLLLNSLQTDVQKYDILRHPRACEEYHTLIDEINAFNGRIEQLRRKEVLTDISMTGVYDENVETILGLVN